MDARRGSTSPRLRPVVTPTLTSDQVLALAPDAASARAGAALATPRQWVQVGADGERAVWGECRGSGT